MNSKKVKEKWGKPKLIVLVKGKQDEAVLAGCKSTALIKCGANCNAGNCNGITQWWPVGNCNACSAITAS